MPDREGGTAQTLRMRNPRRNVRCMPIAADMNLALLTRGLLTQNLYEYDDYQAKEKAGKPKGRVA